MKRTGLTDKWNKLLADYKNPMGGIVIAPETFPEVIVGQTRYFYDVFKSNEKYTIQIELVEWNWVKLVITDGRYKDEFDASKCYFFNFDFVGNFKNIYSDFEHDMGFAGGQETYDELVNKIHTVQNDFQNAVEDFRYFVTNKEKEKKNLNNYGKT